MEKNNQEKPVIFIYIGGYLPAKKQGGPVTSIRNFVEHFHDKYEIRIVCSEHEMGSKERFPDVNAGWNKRDYEYVYYLPVEEFKENKFIELMNPFKDRIYAAYLSGVYIVKLNLPAIKACEKLNIPIVLAPRGDIMRSTIRMNGFKSALKKYSFLGLARLKGYFKPLLIQATSEEEREGAIKYLGVPSENIVLLANLPMAPSYKEKIEKVSGKIRLLFISRIMVKKNLKHAIEVVAAMPNSMDIEFDIYGPIEEPNYWKECSELIEKAQSPQKKIQYCGSLRPEKAKEIYKQYDAFLFPTLSENYGHVIAEALLNDCMVLISKGTTPWDSFEGHGVYLGRLDSTSEFVEAITQIAEMDAKTYEVKQASNRKYIMEKLKIEELRSNYEKMLKAAQKQRRQ